MRSLFTAFGEIESVSVCEFKQATENGNDEAEGEQKSNDSNENCVSTFESRFAHLVFTKKSSMKSVLAASDAAFYELTKVTAKVR